METKSSNYLFFLGGHDLEMLEIKKLLIQHKKEFVDHDLAWDNATWKDYSDEILNPENKGKTFVGIELFDKENIPEGATDIDHHSFNSDRESSIEQVAELLNIKLSHWQELVAANDRGYIPAMIERGATSDEIFKIRMQDRKSQGVTKEDEQLAEESIKENLKTNQGFTLVKSLTNKFSPIKDRLHQTEQLVIYNDQTLTYYGKHVDRLNVVFEPLLKNHQAYSGGGKNGFFGLTSDGINYFGNSENAIHQIIKIVGNGK